MIYTTPWKTLQTLLGTISRLGRPLPSVNPSGKKFNIYIYFFFLHILIPPINSHYYLKKKKKLEKGFAKRVTLCVSPESHLSSVRDFKSLTQGGGPAVPSRAEIHSESNRDGRQMKPKIRVFPDTISVPPICTRESHFRPVWIETATGRSLPPSLNQYSYQVSNQQHVNEKSRGSTRYSLSNITHFT
jgi:hypothetical protein